MNKGISIFFVVVLLLLAIIPTEAVIVSAQNQVLFINEVMASNSQTIRDGDIDDKKEGSNGGAYSDWIEIYNSGDQPVNLTGYTLSDSEATWTFPNCVIQARGYLIVWASDKDKVAKNGQLHTNFKLSASGEEVILKDPNGNVVDYVKFESLSDDQSYGRKTDGSSQFVIFTKSTPGYSNAMGSIQVKEPVFSKVGGFYTDAFDLEITSDDSEVEIYYTTDGSDPVPGNSGTKQYTGKIRIASRAGEANVLSMFRDVSTDFANPWRAPNGEVFKCTTLKAVAVRRDGSRSKVVTHSYFVDPGIKTRYTLPVISVVTDYNNLFDPQIGIYHASNAEKSGEEWERPAHIEFFEPGGKLGFSQNIGLRIHGGYTRKFPQKSFRIYADGKYGDLGEFKYEIFPGLTKRVNDKKMKNFERLILRQAGNDWSSAYMRDEVLQSLLSHIKTLDTQAARPAILFLNGEYWGIYYVRERYDKEYLKEHYNLDDKKVAILEPTQTISVEYGTQEDADAYTNEVINYLKSNSITQTSTYEYIKTKIDIDNYIVYNIAEIFFGNTDWPGNNVTIWRYKTDDGQYHPEAPYGQDGRWRWMLKDVDFGFGLYNKPVNHDTLSYAAGDRVEGTGNPEWSTFLFRTLLQNTEFRNQFINTFADHLNTTFVPERVIEVINNFESILSPEMTEHANRWTNIKMTASNPGNPGWGDPTGGNPGWGNPIGGNPGWGDPTGGNPGWGNPIGENPGWGNPIGGIPTWGGETTWSQNVQVLKDYARNRPSYMIQFIRDKFSSNGVTGTANITLNTDPSKGYIKINTIDIKSSTPGVKDPSRWTGLYFTGIPVTITAVPQEGYVFDHWEGIAGYSDTVTFTHTGDINITAVFRKDTGATPTPVVTPTNTGLPGKGIIGDANWDGDFNSIDIGLVKMYLLGMINENGINVKACDVNADGEVNSIDFAFMKQKMLGMIDKFPAE